MISVSTQSPKTYLNIICSNSSKAVMGENPAMVHPGTKFIIIYVLVKSETKLYTYNIYCWDSYRIDIAIPKVYRYKEKGVSSPRQVWKQAGKIQFDFKALKIILDRRLLLVLLSFSHLHCMSSHWPWPVSFCGENMEIGELPLFFFFASYLHYCSTDMVLYEFCMVLYEMVQFMSF